MLNPYLRYFLTTNACPSECDSKEQKNYYKMLKVGDRHHYKGLLTHQGMTTIHIIIYAINTSLRTFMSTFLKCYNQIDNPYGNY